MRNNEPQQILVNRKAAAKLLGVGLRTFDRMCSAGLVGPRSSKLGGTRVWNVQELTAWTGHAGDGELPDRHTWAEMRKKATAGNLSAEN